MGNLRQNLLKKLTSIRGTNIIGKYELLYTDIILRGVLRSKILKFAGAKCNLLHLCA